MTHLSLSASHCQECGMLVEPPYSFHPHLFCLLKKANPRRDPWTDFKGAVELLLAVELRDNPPSVSALPLDPRDVERTPRR